MAIAAKNLTPQTLTYEQYIAEGEIKKRYDIVDGVRIFMPNPTRRHQRIIGNVYTLLRDYERISGRGQALIAPCDVLIRRHPLRTRQPDALFISNEQLARCGEDSDPAPLEAAPELVVEILSPTETRRLRDAKIADYRAIGVQECWVVSPEAETVEVLRLTPEHAETVAVYSNSQTLRSALFPDLTAAVAGIFAS